MLLATIPCIVLVISLTSATSEQVWLQDLNSDIDARHLESGLPSTLNFRLSRRGKDLSDVVLNLKENTRLNPEAPVFDVQQTANGKQKLMRRKSSPMLSSKFYQDRNLGGVFQVTCQNQKGGPCQRMVYGQFSVSGRDYEIRPAPSGPELPSPDKNTRDLGDLGDVPHILIPSSKDSNVPNINTNTFSDGANIPENSTATLIEELKSFLSAEQRERINNKLAMKHSRTRRSSPLYALEILVVVDNALWERYYASTSSSDGDRGQATESRLRQHFAHIINGASLRYESIDDPEMNIYLTLSGFLFYTTMSSSNPYPQSSLPVVDGVEHADADTYIENLVPWSNTLTGDLPHNDHIAVFTGYELYTGSVSSTGVAGKAWVQGVCSTRGYRTSINEDTTYFTTVSVFAHELGHNLGSSHDGSGTSAGCQSSDKFIMAPMVASFSQGEAYSVNPWRFSSCSINAFKSYVDSLGSGNCLLDYGDSYDEYESHVTSLPGQLHSPDEQCKLARGDNSYLCSSPTSEDICRTMLCKGDDGYCWFYAAARGTSCGEPSQNKWCIEGLCVPRSEDHVGTVGGDGSTNTGTGSNTETGSEGTVTDAPVQTTIATGGSGSDECVDEGWEGWTCGDISTYFYNNYDLIPSQWCSDPSWYTACCAYCTGGAGPTTTTTTTTTVAPSSGSCEDTGWSCASGPWSCQDLSDYFYATYTYTPAQWCLDPNWKTRCCLYCAGYGI